MDNKKNDNVISIVTSSESEYTLTLFAFSVWCESPYDV